VIEKLLVATRGNPALRIVRTCREMGIKTVAVYSEVDRDSLPVLLADEAVCIGKPDPRDSYLNISRILSAAEITRCNAVHPGWDFLATNAEFADAAQSTGIIWIGPPPDLLRLLSSRLAVRNRIAAAGVPVVPGTEEPLKNPQEAIATCQLLGLPVVVRPVAEYLSRTRIISKEKDIETQIRMCQAEIRADSESDMSGGIVSPEVYIEKLIPDARLIEIQVAIDQQHRTLFFDDREIVEHHGKKFIACAPSPGIKPSQRRQLFTWAEKATRALNWTGISTVSFLLDKNGRAYFYRFTPHLTVFHPVTEIRYGIDLIQNQLLIALDKISEPEQPSTVPAVANADFIITAQFFAENPDAEFEPSPGTVTGLCLPGGPNIRIDTDLIPGSQVTPHYDYALGTISAWAPEKKNALNRFQRALAETTITGIQTSIPFLSKLARNLL